MEGGESTSRTKKHIYNYRSVINIESWEKAKRTTNNAAGTAL